MSRVSCCCLELQGGHGGESEIRTVLHRQHTMLVRLVANFMMAVVECAGADLFRALEAKDKVQEES